ncbi:MAG: hypothetical protein J5846_05830 [Desulfovibrio sp.]|nr:hypothetical protein [Desulfovibrio sp.]
MRKCLLFLCVLCSLCAAAQVVVAKELIFGQKPNRFSLKVADGWQEEFLSNGLQLTSQDQQKSVVIAVNDGEGISLKSLERSLPARLELKDVKKKEEKNSVTFTGIRDGLPLFVQLLHKDWLFVSVISTGLEKKQVDAMLASLSLVLEDEADKVEKEGEDQSGKASH